MLYGVELVKKTNSLKPFKSKQCWSSNVIKTYSSYLLKKLYKINYSDHQMRSKMSPWPCNTIQAFDLLKRIPLFGYSKSSIFLACAVFDPPWWGPITTPLSIAQARENSNVLLKKIMFVIVTLNSSYVHHFNITVMFIIFLVNVIVMLGCILLLPYFYG